MKILAFETSSAACSAALYLDAEGKPGQTFSAHEICPMQHTAVILPMIQSLLDSAAISIADLDAVAFGCGPGSFTGIRIAASLAQGIAFARSLPVMPVSSLAALAETEFLQHGYQKILVSVDARMDQVYWGAYQIENGIAVPVIPDELALPATITQLPDAQWHGVGDGFRVYREKLCQTLGYTPATIHENGLPMAAAILPMAIERFKRKDWVGPADALPVYLR